MQRCLETFLRSHGYWWQSWNLSPTVHHWVNPILAKSCGQEEVRV